MAKQDIRWIQRFNNFSKALSQLKKFIEIGDELNEFEQQGMIKAFEYNFELSWNLIKDYYEYQGVTEIQGSRDAFRMAFNRSLIKDGASWMNMIDSRIKTAHTYNEKTADEISDAIIDTYFDLFTQLHATMTTIISKQGDLFSGKE